MGRRILNRKDLRADFEAAERAKGEDEEEVAEEEDSEDEDEDGEEEEEGEGGEGEEGEEGDEVGDEDAPAPKKRKAVKEPKAKAKPKAKPRSRAAKIVRMKVVWGVFNNSNQRVAVYEYPKRKEADDHAARLTADKKSTHFVQPVKEAIEEKKEA
jgi:cobalamin biosynthesis protein CobT